MKSTLVVFTLLCAALIVQGAAISTPPIQNVKFRQVQLDIQRMQEQLEQVRDQSRQDGAQK